MKPARVFCLTASLKLIYVCLWFCATVCFAADPKGKFSATNSPALDEMGYPKDPAAALAQGQNEARRDFTNDVFKIKFGGLPAPHTFTYHRLLAERCRVKVDYVCGCIGSEGTFEYIKGYNSVAKARLGEIFGTNILDELWQQAETEDATPKATSYKIKAGDTLLKIARRHGITLKALLAANPEITSPKIKVGQTLVIPAVELPKQK